MESDTGIARRLLFLFSHPTKMYVLHCVMLGVVGCGARAFRRQDPNLVIQAVDLVGSGASQYASAMVGCQWQGHEAWARPARSMRSCTGGRSASD